MSKLNAYRIMNLNYNNGDIKVQDELYEYGGLNTLMMLRNGGGKSVLVQMMMSQFLNRKSKDIKDRKFENYFQHQGSTPTILLSEWILDDEAGYVLVGSIIRKKPQSDNEYDEEFVPKETIDITSFIHEYKEANNCDIHRVPFIKEGANSKTIKTYSQCIEDLKELENNNPTKFSYYNLSNSSHISKYFKRLKSYGLDTKEFEGIIKKINLDESGLTRLFEDCKRVEDLLKKWIIPSVEKKVNNDTDKIKNFRELISRFTLNINESKKSIELVEGIEEIIPYLNSILDNANALDESYNQTVECSNILANMYRVLKEKAGQIDYEISLLQDEDVRLKEELNEVIYEEHSYDYHMKDKEKRENEENLGIVELEIDDIKEEISKIEKNIGIQKASKKYKVYQKQLSRNSELEMNLNKAKIQDEKLQQEINNVGYSLKLMYESDLKHSKEELEKCNEHLLKLNNDKNDYDNKLQILSNSILDCNNEISYFNAKVDEYKSKEDKFINKHKNFNLDKRFDVQNSMILNYSENELDMFYEGLVNRKNDTIKIIDNYESELNLNYEKLDNLQNNREQEIEKRQSIKLQKESLGKERTLLEEEQRNVKVILKYLGLGEDNQYNKDKVIDSLDNYKADIELGIKRIDDEVDKIKQQIERLNSGKNIEIPSNVLKVLENNNIKQVYGMKWLKENSMKLSDKKKLLKDNPFIPYSLIMSEKEIEILKEEHEEVFVDFPIPIINQSDLENKKISVINNVASIGDINFYIKFNEKILDKNALKEELDKLEHDIKIFEKARHDNQQDLDRTNDYRYKITSYNMNKQYILGIEDKIIKLDEELSIVEKNITDNNNIKENINTDILKLKDALKSAEANKREIDICIEDFREFKSENEKYVKIAVSILEKKEKLNKLNIENANINEQISALDEKIKISENDKLEKENLKNASNRLYIEFAKYNQGDIVDKNKAELEGMYKALTSKQNADITNLQHQLDLNKEYMEQSIKDLDDLNKQYNIQLEDYENINPSDVMLESLMSNKELKEKHIYEKNQEKEKLSNHISRLELSKEFILDKILDKCKRDKAKALEEITAINFDDRKREIKLKINEIKFKLEKSKALLNKLNDIIKIYSYQLDKIVSTDIIEIDIDVEDIEKEIKKKYAEYESLTDLEEKVKKQLVGSFRDLNDKFSQKESSNFKGTISKLSDIIYEDSSNKEKSLNIMQEINTVKILYSDLMEKYQKDRDKVEKEYDAITGVLTEYAKEIYTNIDLIDDTSYIEYNNKRKQLLQIKQLEFNEDAVKTILRKYLKETVDVCIDKLSRGESIEDEISTRVKTYRMYDETLGIKNVGIKIVKFEERSEKLKTWEEIAATASGGEGLVSAFVLLSSLMSYMRKEDDFLSKKESKFLVMDNPFGKANAEHLLRPLMIIAEKHNIQLVCFTGLNGDSIINKFDNIYTLNILESKNGKQDLLSSTHNKGDVLIEKLSTKELSAVRFKIEENYYQGTLELDFD